MTIRSNGSAPLLLVALLMLAAALPEALAQDAYPNRPIRMILPVAPGGGTDALARMIAQGLLERGGRQVVVEHRTGAGTLIASEIVAKAKPDGYTLLMTTSTHSINPAVYKKMPYDMLHKETVAILRVPDTIERLANDGADVVANSPEEFAAFIKAETVKWAGVAKAAGIHPE